MDRIGVTYRKESKIGPYDAAIRAAGLEPVHITPQAPRTLAGLRGLLLTGGSDLNPIRYRQPVNGAEGIDDERDALEADRLAEALASDLPVLAICRGAQLLNVEHGGSLIQHLERADIHDCRIPKWEMGRQDAAHSIEVAPGTRLASIIGAGAHEVNSRHHQSALEVGKGLSVSAVAPDGVIEAVERPDKTFVVGVQWHPEDRYLVSGADLKLFQAFASAVAGAAVAA